MISQPFDYQAPVSLKEVLQSLTDEGAKPLAGGMSLIPMMKLRLAAPEALVDLRQVAELRSMKLTGGTLTIGAMVTHYELESTPLIKTACPLLAAAAASIGDVQVRNRGTIGGAIAHADPAADHPAALLALEAEFVLASTKGERTVPASEFFVDTFTTALQPGELITQIRIAAENEGTGTAYEKRVQPASGFAIVGVAARIRRAGGNIEFARVAINGVGGKAYRADRVESLIQGTAGSADDIRAAAAGAAEGIEASSDIHASAEYRSHLARVLTARALTLAITRAS
jgi:aerobic carbon-monoxide dehydrogenase medium subunit